MVKLQSGMTRQTEDPEMLWVMGPVLAVILIIIIVIAILLFKRWVWQTKQQKYVTIDTYYFRGEAFESHSFLQMSMVTFDSFPAELFLNRNPGYGKGVQSRFHIQYELSTMSGHDSPEKQVWSCPFTHVEDCLGQTCSHLLEIFILVQARCGAWGECAGGRVETSSRCPLARCEWSRQWAALFTRRLNRTLYKLY